MSTFGGPFSRSFALAALLLGVTASLAFWWWTPTRSSQWLATRTGERLREGTGEELVIAAGQLRAMGEMGWQELVAAVDSKRPETRTAAMNALSELVTEWRQWPAAVSMPRVARLAEILAWHLPELDQRSGEVGRRLADQRPRTTRGGVLEPSEAVSFRAELAQQFLAWPSDGESRLGLVYACEQTLKWARNAGWPKSPLPESPPNPPAEVVEVVRSRSSQKASSPQETRPPSSAEAQSPLVANPGSDGELTAVPRRISPLDVFADDDRLRLEEVRPQGAEVAPPAPLDLPDFLFVPPSRLPGQSNASSPDHVPSAPSAALPEGAESSPVPAEPDWKTVGIPELIAAMREPRFHATGEEELRRRGANELNVRVARVATSESVDERMRLVRMLPELTGIDSIGWLLLLARDPSPRVRATAVRFLATGAEPRIRRELKTLEETEEDEEVLVALRAARP